MCHFDKYHVICISASASNKLSNRQREKVTITINQLKPNMIEVISKYKKKFYSNVFLAFYFVSYLRSLSKRNSNNRSQVN